MALLLRALFPGPRVPEKVQARAGQNLAMPRLASQTIWSWSRARQLLARRTVRGIMSLNDALKRLGTEGCWSWAR